jgi:4-amino-4-deoxy-L-arabinose transferase-like glycosyltransferase
MLAAVGREEVTPPLYYVLAWAWAVVIGDGEVALRSLSALLGTALVPVVYGLARRLAPPRVALLAAALVAVSPLLVWYSQEARSYALVLLLAGLSLLFFLRAVATGGGRDLLGWALASALALASHYFALFLVGAEALWLLAAVRRRGTVAAVGTVGLAGLALLPTALAQQSGRGVEWIADHPLLWRILLVPKKLLLGETGFLLPGTRLAAYGLVLAALLLLWRAEPDERRAAGRAALLMAAIVVPPLLLALGGLDYLVARNVTIAMLPGAVLVALGPGSRRAGWPGAIVAGGLLALLTAVTVAAALLPSLGREDWRGLARELDRPPAPRMIAVVPAHEERSLRQYLGRLERPPPGARVPELLVIQTNRAGPRPTPPAPPGFDLVERRERQRLIVIRYRASDPRAGAPAPATETLGRAPFAPLLQRPDG